MLGTARPMGKGPPPPSPPPPPPPPPASQHCPVLGSQCPGGSGGLGTFPRPQTRRASAASTGRQPFGRSPGGIRKYPLASASSAAAVTQASFLNVGSSSR